MPVIGERITVAATATAIFTPTNGAAVDRKSAIIKLPAGAAVSVYLGGSGVTTAAGYELTAGDIIDVSLLSGDTVYGIVAAGTEVVHVLRDRS
jgi:hypothetical protein